MGQIRFPRVWFQAPSSVTFLHSPNSWGQNSVSSSQPIIVCQSELTKFAAELSEFTAELSSLKFSSLNSALETVFRPFPESVRRKNGVTFVMENLNCGHFGALFPQERRAARLHEKLQGICHSDFGLWFLGKFSPELFCCLSLTELSGKCQ